ncbi:unnamed protein product [Nesidiocoris tenuis]|uniref:Uncharacterized protein n=1 Tax=Nesidiocoris tenuis TaxID=355587 RepID=A0A6H5HQ90_9HEMI|nr:unnamed protein product [Nesidiocoris tenuis]
MSSKYDTSMGYNSILAFTYLVHTSLDGSPTSRLQLPTHDEHEDFTHVLGDSTLDDASCDSRPTISTRHHSYRPTLFNLNMTHHPYIFSSLVKNVNPNSSVVCSPSCAIRMCLCSALGAGVMKSTLIRRKCEQQVLMKLSTYGISLDNSVLVGKQRQRYDKYSAISGRSNQKSAFHIRQEIQHPTISSEKMR